MTELSNKPGVGARRISRGAQGEARKILLRLAEHPDTKNTMRYLNAAGKGYIDLMEGHGMSRQDVMEDLQESRLIGKSLETLNTHGKKSGILERNITHKDLMAFILRSKRTRANERRKR